MTNGEFRMTSGRWQAARVARVLAAVAGLAAAQVRPIRDVRQNDYSGQPLLAGQRVTVTGVVTEAGHFGTWGPGFMQDSTGGVALYDSMMKYVVIGDSVTVTGEVSPYYGLAELKTLEVVKHGLVTAPEPRLMTLNQVAWIDTAAGYVETEGWLARFERVQIDHTSGQAFEGNKNYVVRDSAGNTSEVRIDADAAELVGLLIPDGYFTLTGVIGQYRRDPPYFGGYQIMPRVAADVGVAPRPLLTIRAVQKPGPDGVTPLLVDSVVRVRGRITGPAWAFSTSTTSKSLYIQDTTQGINVYRPAYAPAHERLLDSVGVEVEVTGTVTEYNGLTELANGTLTVIDTVKLPVVPKLLPFNIGLSEALESNLLSVVADIVQAPVLSGSGWNLVVKNGSAALAIRIGDKTQIPVAQMSWLYERGRRVRFTGVGGQYDYDEPFNSGYQLLPRFLQDISDTTAAFPPSEYLRLDTIAPNPFCPAEGQVASIRINSPRSGYRLTVKVFDLEGRAVKELLANGPGGYYDLKWDGTNETGRRQSAGIYLVNVKASRGDGTTEAISRPVVLAVRLN